MGYRMIEIEKAVRRYQSLNQITQELRDEIEEKLMSKGICTGCEKLSFCHDKDFRGLWLRFNREGVRCMHKDVGK